MYPAGVPGVSARYVSLGDGLTVRVIESGPASASAVLLVHGWGGCVYSFAEMLPALAAAGHRAIAFDLPGHGLSDKPRDESRFSTRALSNVVLAVADAVGVRGFTFVGHSMGGSLGLDLAVRGERRVERLVLIDAVGIGAVPSIGPLKLLSPRILNRLVPKLLTRAVVKVILRGAFSTAGRPTERDIDEYWAPTQFDGLAAACRACVHRATWARQPATTLRELRLPVLVIAGGRDRIVRGSAARAALIPGARVVPIREGGHLALQECADQTNEELLKFLSSATNLAANSYRS